MNPRDGDGHDAGSEAQARWRIDSGDPAQEMADRLRLEAGDTVIAIETDRGIVRTPYDADTEEALAIAAQVGRAYRNALRTLAK